MTVLKRPEDFFLDVFPCMIVQFPRNWFHSGIVRSDVQFPRNWFNWGIRSESRSSVRFASLRSIFLRKYHWCLEDRRRPFSSTHWYLKLALTLVDQDQPPNLVVKIVKIDKIATQERTLINTDSNDYCRLLIAVDHH